MISTKIIFTVITLLITQLWINSSAHAQNDELTLTIIGSGSPQMNPDRAGPSALINYKDTYIIVDTGNRTQARLNEIGLRIKQLDAILYTHHHLDHNEEFIPIFIRSLLGDNQFSLVGPPPMKAMNKSTLSQYKTDIEYRMRRSGRTLNDVIDNYTVKEISGESSFMIGEIKVSSTKVNHTIDAVAYRFDAGGHSIVISGDLTYSKSLSTLAKDTDVLLIESGGTVKIGGKKGRKKNFSVVRSNNNSGKGRQRAHVTLAETAQMSQESGAKKIVLTHFTNGENDEPATITELRKMYQGEIIFGEDLMTINVHNHTKHSNTSSEAHSTETRSKKSKPNNTLQDNRASSYSAKAAARAAKKMDFLVRPTNPCSIDPEFENIAHITQDLKNRKIVANAIPNHKIGSFPNSGNPNRLSEQNKTYTVPLLPVLSNEITYLYDRAIDHGRPNYVFGVALNGVKFEPTANEYFYGSNGNNYDWTIEALSKEVFLGDDCNNAHIQPNGEYHYHGSPTGLINKLISQQKTSSMVLAGWAADGFPIYYSWGYSNTNKLNSPIKKLTSSFQLRQGNRPGDGKTAPDGKYSGLYARDYVYQAGSGDLDQCNGRQGVTPEFPNGTYYYVLTNEFPFVGRCLAGKPSGDFKVGGGNRSRTKNNQNEGTKPRQSRPNPARIINRMDKNGDNKISQNEASGRLKNNFSKRDKNKDGYISLDELKPR